MTNTLIVHSDARYTLLRVQPAAFAFTASAPMGRPLNVPAHGFAINANYYDETDNVPLGVMLSGGIPLPYEPIKRKLRTALVIQDGRPLITPPLSYQDIAALQRAGEWQRATVIQAGPALVREGRSVSGDPEMFTGSGALVQSQHAAIGLTADAQMLLLYVENALPTQMAPLLLQHGVRSALKVDGGHAAYLSGAGSHRGAANPYTALIAGPM